MKILITGGTGFIGAHMANYLHQKNHDVTICDNNFRGTQDKFVDHLKFIKCDLTKKSDLQLLETDYDCVYHFAAINGTENFYKIPHEVLTVNALTNINVLEWCVENNIQKILSTSSSEVYAATPDKKIPTPENVSLCIDDVSNMRYSYAASKIYGESLFLSYHNNFDIDVRIVRPHNVYGPRMGFKHVIPQLIYRVHKKENPFTVYGKQQSRSFCYIDDAVICLEEIMNTSSCSGKIINLGTESETKIEDLVNIVLDVCNYDPQLVYADAPTGSVERRCPDISLVKKLTQYRPTTSLLDGVKKSCDWYNAYYKDNTVDMNKTF